MLLLFSCSAMSKSLVTPMDCNLPGFFVRGICWARILEWAAISFSRRSSWPRDWTRVSYISCIGRQILHYWATRKGLFHICMQVASVMSNSLWPCGLLPVRLLCLQDTFVFTFLLLICNLSISFLEQPEEPRKVEEISSSPTIGMYPFQPYPLGHRINGSKTTSMLQILLNVTHMPFKNC